MNIGGSNELLADFKLYWDQNQQQAFAKTFWLLSYINLHHSRLLFPDLRGLVGTFTHI